MRNVSGFTWLESAVLPPLLPEKVVGAILLLLFVLRILLTPTPAAAPGAQTLPLPKFHFQTFRERLQIECLIAANLRRCQRQHMQPPLESLESQLDSRFGLVENNRYN